MHTLQISYKRSGVAEPVSVSLQYRVQQDGTMRSFDCRLMPGPGLEWLGLEAFSFVVNVQKGHTRLQESLEQAPLETTFFINSAIAQIKHHFRHLSGMHTAN